MNHPVGRVPSPGGELVKPTNVKSDGNLGSPRATAGSRDPAYNSSLALLTKSFGWGLPPSRPIIPIILILPIKMGLMGRMGMARREPRPTGLYQG